MILENNINHTEYQKKVKSLSRNTLLYIIQDCNAALKALPNGNKSGYYSDEISYCSAELKRRDCTGIKPCTLCGK